MHGTGDGIRINDDGTDAVPAPTLTDDTFTYNSGDAVHVVNTVPQAPWTVSVLSAGGKLIRRHRRGRRRGVECDTWRMANDPGLPLYVGSGITVRGAPR